MNKLVQKAACIALLAALMGGCSMNDKKDANTKTNETKEAAEKSVKDAKNKTEDSIDNILFRVIIVLGHHLVIHRFRQISTRR